MDSEKVSAARARRQERKAMRSALLSEANQTNDPLSPTSTRKSRRERRSSLDTPVGGGAVFRNDIKSNDQSNNSNDPAVKQLHLNVSDDNENGSQFDVLAAMDSMQEEETLLLFGRQQSSSKAASLNSMSSFGRSPSLTLKNSNMNNNKNSGNNTDLNEGKDDKEVTNGNKNNNRNDEGVRGGAFNSLRSEESIVGINKYTPVVLDKPFHVSHRRRSSALRSTGYHSANHSHQNDHDHGRNDASSSHIPPIAVSPRLQEVSLRDDGESILFLNEIQQEQRTATTSSSSFSSMMSRLFSRQTNHNRHQSQSYSERLTKKCQNMSDQLYTASSSDWLEKQGEGTHQNSRQESIIRFGGSDVLKERMVRDLVSLVQKESQHTKYTNQNDLKKLKKNFDEDSDESEEEEEDDSDEEKKGDDSKKMKKLKKKKMLKKKKKKKSYKSNDESDKRKLKEMAHVAEISALSSLRSRGYATLDDIVDAYGDIIGCDDPIIHHSVRPMKDRYLSLQHQPHQHQHHHHHSTHMNPNHPSSPRQQHHPPPPPPPPNHPPPHQRPLTIVRTPTTGVGPSIKASHHSFIGGRTASNHLSSPSCGPELVLKIGRVSLYDHPLFWPEDTVACLLRSSHAKYVRELEENPSKFLSLRLASCVQNLEAALKQQKVNDPKLSKLISRAYPMSSLHNQSSDKNDKKNEKKKQNNDKKKGEENKDNDDDDDKKEEGVDDINVGLVDTLWQESVSLLSQLMEAERAGRALTKHVYFLWRALLVTREDLSSVMSEGGEGDNEAYGRGGELMRDTRYSSRKKHTDNNTGSTTGRRRPQGPASDGRTAVTSLKLKIVQNPSSSSSSSSSSSPSMNSSSSLSSFAPLSSSSLVTMEQQQQSSSLSATSNSSSSSTSSSMNFKNFKNAFIGKRIQRICGGGICGELGFFVGEPQKFKAISVGASIAWTLTHDKLMLMHQKDPQLAILVQTALLKSLALFDSQQFVHISQQQEN